MYNLADCIIGLRWWSKNSDAFSVGVPQFEMTGRPGTFSNRLCILGSKYILPKLAALL